MIELKSVSKIYSNDGVLTTGLHHVSLSFEKGEIVGIVGESGSGKSTLLNVITKTDTFEEGEYYFQGNETSYFDMDDMDYFRKRYVGFIFQNYNILEAYTVLENVMLPLLINGISRKEAKKKALELIDRVGLTPRIRNRAAQLSGGEKQRCVIARALAMDVPILARDEPTGNLDAKTGAEIIRLIKEVAKDRLVIIVTHNEKEVESILTRKIRMKDGEVVEDIMISPVKKQEDEEMNLDYVPLHEKTRLSLAFSNLKNTPRRTFLTSLVFLCVSVFALILYQFTFYLSDTLTKETPFLYEGNDKVVVYHADGSEVDMNDLKGRTYVINHFAYGTSVSSVDLEKTPYTSTFAYESNPKNLRATYGRLPEKENECMVLVAEDNGEAESMLGVTFSSLSGTSQNGIKSVHFPELTIVGCQVRNDLSISYCTVYTGNEALDKATRVITMFDTCYSTWNYNVVYDYTGSTRFVLPDTTQKVSNDDFTNTLHDFHLDFTSYPVSYDSSLKQPTLYLGNDLLTNLEEHPYEVTVYTSSPNSFQRKMKRLGYDTIRVSTYDSGTQLINVLSNLMTIGFMILSSLVLILLYFLSYLILSRVYQSKTKEFGIFRILGVAKMDMRHIVRMEVGIEMLVTSVLSYLVFLILGKTIENQFFLMFSSIPALTVLLYFGILFLFGLLLGNRFNRRLFHFSAQGNLKGGKVK